MILNREKLAEVIGCSLRTVDDYRRQGMPGDAPQRPGGQWRFDSAAVVDWLRTRERNDALGEIAGISESDAKRRKIAAEAAMAEHDLAVKVGAAVAVDDWRAATEKLISAARAKLLPIGKSIGPDVAQESDPAQCELIVQGAIHEALQELSTDEIQIESGGVSESEQGDAPHAEPVGAAAGSDSQRVGRRRKAAESREQREAR